MPKFQFRWLPVIAANIFVWAALGVLATTRAAPQPPFANSVQQRADMIRELKEIKALLKEQNLLLRTAPMDQAVEDPRP